MCIFVHLILMDLDGRTKVHEVDELYDLNARFSTRVHEVDKF